MAGKITSDASNRIDDLKIFHMASFSRSGETMLLRSLASHPQIHIVHQIRKTDKKRDTTLFRFLREYEHLTIPRDHLALNGIDISDSHKVIVCKNATWEHRYEFNGFILVRNPFSVFRSFGNFGELYAGFKKRQRQFERWANKIDKLLLPALREARRASTPSSSTAFNWNFLRKSAPKKLKEPVEYDFKNISLFCMLYNRKLFELSTIKSLPIIHYEKFVSNPPHYLMKICRHLGLDYDPIMADSHKLYENNEIGHGGIKLSQAIHDRSSEKYKSLSSAVLSQIYGLCYPSLKAYGYEFDGKSVTINPDFCDRFE